MALDLDNLLEKLRELTQAAQEPGRLSREQLAAEVEKLTADAQEALTAVAAQLQEAGSADSGLPLEQIQAQILAVLQQSGLTVEKTEEMKKLTQELELLKRAFIPS